MGGDERRGHGKQQQTQPHIARFGKQTQIVVVGTHDSESEHVDREDILAGDLDEIIDALTLAKAAEEEKNGTD